MHRWLRGPGAGRGGPVRGVEFRRPPSLPFRPRGLAVCPPSLPTLTGAEAGPGRSYVRFPEDPPHLGLVMKCSFPSTPQFSNVSFLKGHGNDTERGRGVPEGRPHPTPPSSLFLVPSANNTCVACHWPPAMCRAPRSGSSPRLGSCRMETSQGAPRRHHSPFSDQAWFQIPHLFPAL